MQSPYHRNAHKLFFRLFPPPNFMLRPSVGIDISDRAIRFVELIPQKDKYRLGKWGERDLPAGVVENGEIKDMGTLKTALIGLRRDFKISFVHASIPNEQTYLFKTEVPDNLSADEIKGNIGFQLEEHVPVPSSEAVFDYEIPNLPAFGKAKPGVKEVMVSVCSAQVIQSYLDAYSESGITPLSFEVEDSALARSLVPEGDCNTYMLVDYGALRTGIVIVSNGAVRFATTVEVGSRKLTDAIAKRLSISFDQALALEREGAFSRHGKYRELFPLIVSSAHDLKKEVEKHFLYWHNHPDKGSEDSPQINKILFCGEGAIFDGIAEHFALAVRTEVVIGDVWQNALSFDDGVPDIPFENALSFATAIGLALRGS